ncbi:MAG: hypothetical protein ACWGHO_04650 [Candidatus Moraniibacteriota bacterium]
MNEAIISCPRFKNCSVNKCPLDSDSNLRVNLFSERKCDIAKSIRLKIGKKYKLPKLGLTKAEYVGYRKWNSLPEEEKNIVRRRMCEVRENIIEQNHLWREFTQKG